MLWSVMPVSPIGTPNRRPSAIFNQVVRARFSSVGLRRRMPSATVRHTDVNRASGNEQSSWLDADKKRYGAATSIHEGIIAEALPLSQ